MGRLRRRVDGVAARLDPAPDPAFLAYAHDLVERGGETTGEAAEAAAVALARWLTDGLGLGEVELSPMRERRYRTRTGSIPKQRSLLPSPRGCLLSYLGRLHWFSLGSAPTSVLASMPHHTDSGRRQSADSWALRVKSLGGKRGPPDAQKSMLAGKQRRHCPRISRCCSRASGAVSR